MDDTVKNQYAAPVVRPREFDEESVLNAAREQFRATGFAGTSMDAIAAATGLGKGSLYGAFGGKRELFHRVFGERCTAMVDAAEQRLSGPDDQALERLSTYLRVIAVGSAEPSHRGCLLAQGTAELAQHDEVVATRALKTFEDLRAVFAGTVAACQRNGDLDPTADPQQLAALLLAVHRGMEALGKAGTPESELIEIAEGALAGLPRPR